MNAPPENLLFDVALEWEEASFERHEFILGRLRRRQGRPPRECDVIMNLLTAFGTRARNTKYRCLSSEMRLRIGDEPEWFYPTLFLYEPPLRFHARDEKGFINPRLIVEVFSLQTPPREASMRLYRYTRIPELSDYVTVEADEVFVRHYRRLENGRWATAKLAMREAELRLDNFDISVPLAEIYESIQIEKPALSRSEIFDALYGNIEVEEQPVLPFEQEPGG